MGNLEKRIWTEELSIGNADIDIDHKKLIDIYNDLVEFVRFKKGHEEFAKILSKMTDYSLVHFKREEQYMQKMSYPKLAEHEKSHKNYVFKVAIYNVDLLGINPPDPNDIIKFLGKWWITHILKSDKDYEDYRNEIQADVTY
ncbi:hypothetical protein MNBD_BACTEROID01-1700 [hydrothermal vent metagenome]|uniref:Hemerythrin-like domain-containing protein n=1 Tax=hydrothermal vent metagenome TaxID=652676 RepID=A0A3B0U3R3_9ZZZZ